MNRSCRSLLTEQVKQNEWIALFEHKSDLLCMAEQFVLFMSESLIFLDESDEMGEEKFLCSFKFIAVLVLLKKR